MLDRLPPALLRLESALLFAIALILYRHEGEPWLLFVLLLLAPDFSMLGYLTGNRAGAAVYNCAHTYVGPAVLAGLGLIMGKLLPVALALIWMAHIALDRVLGYGLKYPSGFKDTHLSRL